MLESITITSPAPLSTSTNPRSVGSDRAAVETFLGRSTSNPAALRLLTSGEDILDRVAVVDLQALASWDVQTFGIEAEQV